MSHLTRRGLSAFAIGSMVVGIAYAGMAQTSRVEMTPAKPAFASDGRLMQPTGYREWIHLGTPLTPNDLNPPEAPFPEFHNVYIHPADYEQYKKTGTFADGTVLIKELITVGAKKATSGVGYFMGEFIGLEAAIKDSRRFKGEPGYWAYFSFGHSYPLETVVSKQPVSTCNTCHQENAADDWVFSQYYPVLRAARPQGR